MSHAPSLLPRPLLLLLLVAVAHADEVGPEKVAESGKGVLYRYGDQRVLVVAGTPREMGLAHGKLLAKEIKEDVRAFLDDWAISDRGRTREELQAIWEKLSPHIPKRYLEEIDGIALGSGVPVEDLRLIHAIPSRYHCTGAAALPSVTKDGKLYHTRSLDYSLDIGKGVRPQTNAILLVCAPDEGFAHAIVSWAGFVGCVTGMNLEGVAVGEMGSHSSDETYDGIPMVFHLREVLAHAKDLAAAKAIWAAGPRTCGFNFVFSDPTDACAVESNRKLVRFFGAGDPREDVAPHRAIDGIVRRCNHFVDPELAATQRDPYDPRESAGGSWAAYDFQGRFLDERRGRIDAEAMIALLRSYPASHPCLHQAVMCPKDRAIWVSNARDPADDPLPGAQNQPFLRYDLRALLAGTPAPAARSGSRADGGAVETGTIDNERAIEGPFAHEPGKVPYRLRALRKLGEVSIAELTYPSPGPSLAPENETVYAEYFRPPGDGPFPSAIVLDILDGRGYVSRMVAAALASRGVAALFVKLPYYGERRPKTLDPTKLDLPDAIGAVKQAVRDIRRGAAWLRGRPDVEGVGIVGVSLGAFVAELAAGADGGFDRCVFVVGGGSIADTIYAGSKDTRKIAAFLAAKGLSEAQVREALEPVEPLHSIGGVGRGGVLMINCTADEVVPRASTERYWEAIGKPEIVWYEGGHYALKDHVFDVLGRITAHFAR
ncbi:MAG TPA: C45 family autoproteolytic acyltransferase/hydrolase [Planctomycetota bacterium]|nr:C45 family autoproteolytic acyltransferase/hydrolase [Planctomycetota bacterium]